MKLLQLASLALVALLPSPPLLALTITQTETGPLSYQFKNNNSGSLSGNVFFNPYDPAAGPLTSAKITVEWTAHGSVSDTNPFDYPLNYNPFISVSPLPYLTIAPVATIGNTIFLPQTFETVSGPEVTLLPHAHHTFTTTLQGTTSLYITSPADLALLSGSASPRLHFGAGLFGSTGFGGFNSNGGTVTATLVYNVPDHGLTFAYLAVFFAGLIALHRHSKTAAA